MPHFETFHSPSFVFALEGVKLQLSGNPHAQLKTGDEGCQRGFLPQFILQIRQLQQGLLILRV